VKDFVYHLKSVYNNSFKKYLLSRHFINNFHSSDLTKHLLDKYSINHLFSSSSWYTSLYERKKGKIAVSQPRWIPRAPLCRFSWNIPRSNGVQSTSPATISWDLLQRIPMYISDSLDPVTPQRLLLNHDFSFILRIPSLSHLSAIFKFSIIRIKHKLYHVYI